MKIGHDFYEEVIEDRIDFWLDGEKEELRQFLSTYFDHTSELVNPEVRKYRESQVFSSLGKYAAKKSFTQEIMDFWRCVSELIDQSYHEVDTELALKNYRKGVQKEWEIQQLESYLRR